MESLTSKEHYFVTYRTVTVISDVIVLTAIKTTEGSDVNMDTIGDHEHMNEQQLNTWIAAEN